MQTPSTKAPEAIDIALGGAIRRRRRDAGMSQEALAEQCGVSFQQVQKYENGVNRISFSRLVQIARALNCPLVELLGVLDPAEPTLESGPDFLTALRSTGAADLLKAFDTLAPEGRTGLVNFLRIVTLGGKPATDH